MSELLHEVPSDQELRTYCVEHFVGSVFYLMRESRSKLEKIYPPDIVIAIESLSALGGEEFCKFAMTSIFESLRRLNRLPRTDPIWADSNNRPTIYKVSEFCKQILARNPDDFLSLWTLGCMSVWAYGNRFGQHYWKRLYRLGRLELTSALHAALLIQITANDTAQQFAEFLQESGTVADASSTLTKFREQGGAFLSGWVDRVLEVLMRTSLKWLQTPSDLAAFAAADRAALFIYVDWSVDAGSGRGMVERSERHWAKWYAQWPMSWWAVDVSGGTSPLAGVVDWLAAQQQRIGQSADQLINSGHGPLFWIQHGRVVGFARAVSQSGVDGLEQRTREVFGVNFTKDVEYPLKIARLWRPYRLHELSVPSRQEMIGLGESGWKQLLICSSMEELHAKYEFYSMKAESSCAGDTDNLQVVTRDLEGAYYAVGEFLFGRIPSHRERKRPWDSKSGRCLKLRAFSDDFLTIEIARSRTNRDWKPSSGFGGPREQNTEEIKEILDTRYCWLDQHFPEDSLEKRRIEDSMREGADLSIAEEDAYWNEW